jgi:hypothetical protein
MTFNGDPKCIMRQTKPAISTAISRKTVRFSSDSYRLIPNTMGIDDTKARPELVREKKIYAARGMVQTRMSVLA